MDFVFLIKALQLILSLSILVILHEFGHYIPAKLFGCRVEKFYLFIDWPFTLFKKKIGETEFGIGTLPLGGYVKAKRNAEERGDGAAACVRWRSCMCAVAVTCSASDALSLAEPASR